MCGPAPFRPALSLHPGTLHPAPCTLHLVLHRATLRPRNLFEDSHVTWCSPWQAPPIGYIRSKENKSKKMQDSIDVRRINIYSLRAQVAQRRSERKEADKMGLQGRADKLSREIYSLERHQAQLQADLLRLSNRAAVLDREIEGDRDRFNHHKVDM